MKKNVILTEIEDKMQKLHFGRKSVRIISYRKQFFSKDHFDRKWTWEGKVFNEKSVFLKENWDWTKLQERHFSRKFYYRGYENIKTSFWKKIGIFCLKNHHFSRKYMYIFFRKKTSFWQNFWMKLKIKNFQKKKDNVGARLRATKNLLCLHSSVYNINVFHK